MPVATAAEPRLRISIRYKILVAIAATLLLAVGAYGYLAVELYTHDKLAYIYDANAATVAGASEEAASLLAVITKELHLFARDGLRPSASAKDRNNAVRDLFGLESDMLRLEIYAPSGKNGELRLDDSYVNKVALEATELAAADLRLLRKDKSVPFEALSGEVDVVLQNSSLPPGTAVVTLSCRNPNGKEVLVADLKHDRLLRVVAKARMHETYMVDDKGEIIAHPDATYVVGRRDVSANPLVKEALRGSVQQGVKEFVAKNGATFIGAFARVPRARLFVITQIPKAEALRATVELRNRTVLFAVGVLCAAFVVSIFLSRLLTSPIRRLRAATEIIGQGRFDIEVDVQSRDEIGDLARAFVRMGTTLRDVQGQLLQSEKMAAFGQLGAGITHEVKNPMTGIVSFAQLAQRKLDDKDKVLEFLKLIEKEALRCRDILVNFLKFARASTHDMEKVDVNGMVDNSANMLRHQLNINNVQLLTALGAGVPAIMGNAPELQQVILNLGINAQQAMSTGGKVTLATEKDAAGNAVIKVSDTGPGIPPEIQAKIFEPFFTTKPPGQGTGLGLSVSFGIVKAHKGTLGVESVVGKGATFVIKLPPAEVERKTPPPPA
ncbi:MAG: HAMP domain-containing protein [Deltaproteobacteria bacterium]|nr:HAMP domain-containing protein [Deltaproteobacteria bacterium]